MREKLKPCPFCGGEAEYGLTMAGEEVYCTACYANMPRMTTADETIRRWNTRADRTCRMVPMWEEPDANGYMTCECDVCGWMADYAADSEPVGWCAGCGAKVVG